MLDAGRVQNGPPFLAMEYVEGLPIDVFAAGLSLRQKVSLFLKVCSAVAYLHRNLVVHRDLKPGNILVTAEGEPKLLDFGIAKIVDLATDRTMTSLRALTPDYASPEQISGAKISTASDIYSLGAILYQLLTGKPAHEIGDRSAEAIASAILAREVTRPSKWSPELRGDLEIILLKTLRKNPHERYATVEQLAEDLEAFLQSRPVRVRAGDTWYRSRKFVRRHWMPVGAASLALAGLSAGLWFADKERAVAQQRFEDVRQLANKLFDIDTQARQVPGNTATRQLIVDTSLEYLQRLAANVRGDPELALEVGTAYMRVARVQGVPISINLGQMAQAEENLRIAERFVHTSLAARPTNRTALLRLAQIAHDRMLVARLDTRRDQALPLARQSEEWLQKFHAQKTDAAEKRAILAVYMNVADEYYNDAQFDSALQLSRRATEVAQALETKPFENQPNIAMFKWVSAEVYQQLGDLDQALLEIRESVKMLEPSPEIRDQARIGNYILVLIWQGRILGQADAPSLGRSSEAVESFDRAFQMADTLAHQDLRDQNSRGRLEMAGSNMADLLSKSDPRRALQIYDHTLRHLAEIPHNSSFRRSEVRLLSRSAYLLQRLGRRAEAKQRLDGAFARLAQLKLYPVETVKLGSPAAEALRAAAAVEAASGNLTRSVEMYGSLLDRIQASKPNPETSLGDAVELSSLYEDASGVSRRAGLASTLEARRRTLWRHWDAKLPHNSFVSRQLAAIDR
jgi:tetratricopeptide (TPR) repeat protein